MCVRSALSSPRDAAMPHSCVEITDVHHSLDRKRALWRSTTCAEGARTPTATWGRSLGTPSTMLLWRGLDHYVARLGAGTWMCASLLRPRRVWFLRAHAGPGVPCCADFKHATTVRDQETCRRLVLYVHALYVLQQAVVHTSSAADVCSKLRAAAPGLPPSGDALRQWLTGCKTQLLHWPPGRGR